MAVLIVLIVLALVALFIVSAVNRKQELEQARRMQQRKLKLQVDAIVDVVNCLEQTIPNHMIAKYINDESIVLLRQILALETGTKTHIENSIRHAMVRSEELASAKSYASASYQKDSDAQITHTQVQLGEAAAMLRHICAQGKISDTELEVFTSELSWAFLMVSVASFIAQGLKFSSLQDRFTAQNYYQKAQNLLLESLHQDSRRTRMIKELSEIIEGSRTKMSRDLLPERALTD
jgi:biopolymer transport protein ExbB/TolQ